MLRIVNFEEIKTLMSRIPQLVDLYENKDPDFPVKAKSWLKKMEQTLENNRLLIAGKIGLLRSRIISAEQGVIPEGIQITGQPTRRKIENATAMHALQHAGETVSGFLQKDYDRFDNAEKQIRQLTAFMKVKGLLADYNGRKSFDTETLKNIWQVVRSDHELIPGVINVESLVGLYDALIILNRQLISEDWS